MRNTAKIFEKLINHFKGVKFDEFKIDGNTCEISFTAECKESLSALISCSNGCPMWTCVYCFYEDPIYTIMFEKEDGMLVVSALRMMLEMRRDVREGVYRIKEYKALNAESKKQYINYIKFLRTLFVNGHEWLSAQELLDMNRICCDCGKELYSKDDEIRTILEFDDPAKAFKILKEITCENDE